ncbi:hypothetical protein [Tenacibaculum sp. E3R01]|uniref:hypothetical protein n=1 Tax=Tenacibaculum sp. E3R01 TaxID=2267227 RepID=UPI0011BD700C|nr:hypothetical protein [Tenacibaculum sp. E3R01]
MLVVIRACFYITNISLANYCGVSYDMLKSLSSKRRAYNTILFNKLRLLHKALTLQKPLTALPYVRVFLKSEEQIALPKLEQTLKKVEKKVRKKQAVLQLLQKKRANWLRGLHACSVLLQKNDLADSDVKWIHLRKKHLDIQLKENSRFRELQLQTEINALEAQLFSLSGFIKELNE